MFFVNKYIRKVKKDNMIILASGINGQWIKISNEVFNIIEDCIKENMNYEDIIEQFESEEDREYIQNVLDCLIKIGIIITDTNVHILDELKTVEEISFEITNRCNLKCKHCIVSANENIKNEDLQYKDIIKICDKIIKLNPKIISLSGGEPLIRKDIWEILAYIKDNYNGKVNIMTNGILINDKNIDRLISMVDMIDISIDGVNEETCSKIRGKGVFSKVIDSTKLLKKKGFDNISLSMVNTKYTREYIEEFYSLCKELDVTPMVRKFVQAGRAKDNKNELFKSSDENKLLENIDYINQRKNINASCCKAQITKLNIKADGEVYPCVLLSENNSMSIGNALNEFRLEDLLLKNKKEYFKDEFDLPGLKKCKNCNVNIFCWICKGEIVEINNDDDLNERCKNRKGILERIVWG